VSRGACGAAKSASLLASAARKCHAMSCTYYSLLKTSFVAMRRGIVVDDRCHMSSPPTLMTGPTLNNLPDELVVAIINLCIDHRPRLASRQHKSSRGQHTLQCCFALESPFATIQSPYKEQSILLDLRIQWNAFRDGHTHSLSTTQRFSWPPGGIECMVRPSS